VVVVRESAAIRTCQHGGIAFRRVKVLCRKDSSPWEKKQKAADFWRAAKPDAMMQPLRISNPSDGNRMD
jgi:hypothetical protein